MISITEGQKKLAGRKKGGAKTGGRKKGVINKTSRIAKENFESVFEQLGGVDAMAEWAQTHQTEFYAHYAKLIPMTVAGDNKNPLSLRVEFVGSDTEKV